VRDPQAAKKGEGRYVDQFEPDRTTEKRRKVFFGGRRRNVDRVRKERGRDLGGGKTIGFKLGGNPRGGKKVIFVTAKN